MDEGEPLYGWRPNGSAVILWHESLGGCVTPVSAMDEGEPLYGWPNGSAVILWSSGLDG